MSERGGDMTTAGVVWIVGILPWAVLCSAACERERRLSRHEDVRRFVRLPAVAGWAGGVLWPLVVVVLAGMGAVWVVGRAGRTLVDFSGVK